MIIATVVVIRVGVRLQDLSTGWVVWVDLLTCRGGGAVTTTTTTTTLLATLLPEVSGEERLLQGESDFSLRVMENERPLQGENEVLSPPLLNINTNSNDTSRNCHAGGVQAAPGLMRNNYNIIHHEV